VILKGETSLATPAPLQQAPALTPTKTDKTLDVISKSVAALAIVLYGSGFIITSIYHSSYGFLESDPLRPRILVAGAWFIIFMAVPVFLVGRFLGHDHWQSKETWWLKLREFLWDYYTGATVICFFVFYKIFDFDPDLPVKTTPDETHHWWSISVVLLVVALVSGLILLAIISAQYRKYVPEVWRKRLGAAYWIGLVSWMLWSSYNELYGKGHFSYSAVILWFLTLGIASVFFARTFRPRQRSIADSLPFIALSFFTAVTTFATIYYPHIKSSLGGGMPIPAIICFSKDSPVMPLQSVPVSIIDESPLGFYVLAPKEKKATFIPRNFVVLIHFSDNASLPFTLNPK